jgi:glutamyl-tRNA reductase
VQTIGADVIPSDRAVRHPAASAADLLKAFRDDQASDEDMATVRHLLSLAMPPDSMIVGADRKLSHF